MDLAGGCIETIGVRDRIDVESRRPFFVTPALCWMPSFVMVYFPEM